MYEHGLKCMCNCDFKLVSFGILSWDLKSISNLSVTTLFLSSSIIINLVSAHYVYLTN